MRLRWPVAFLVGALCACGEAALDIPRPAALPEMDEAVQLDYENRVEALSRAATKERGPRGRALGGVAQWFHLYGFPTEALELYDAAEALDPRGRWAYSAAFLLKEEGELEASLRAFRELETNGAQRAAQLVWMGEIEHSLGLLAEAAEHFDAALEIDPRSAKALAGLGLVALAEGRPEEARERLEAADGFQPGLQPIRQPLGLVYRLLGVEEEAEALLADVVGSAEEHREVRVNDPWLHELEIQRTGVRYHVQEGLDRIERGDLEGAREHLVQAIRSDTENLEARLQLIRVLVLEGRSAAVRSEVASTLDAYPAHDEALYMAGWALAEVGDHAEAASHLEALLVRETSVRVTFLLGQLDLRMGRPETALARFDQTLELEPTLGRAWLFKLVALEQLGDPSRTRLAVDQLRSELRDDTAVSAYVLRYEAIHGPSAADCVDRARSAAEDERSGPTVFLAETYALCLASTERWRQAIVWQEAAIRSLSSALPGSSRGCDLSGLRTRLARYRARQTPRSAWEAGERICAVRVAAPESRSSR